VNGLLHVRVHLDHVLVKLRVLAHHDLRIPSGSDENGFDTALQRRGEAVGDLQADEEGVGDDDGSELALRVVGWVGEDEVEVGEAVEVTVSWVVILLDGNDNLQSADVGHEGRAHGEDGTGQALVDESVHSAVLDHGPGCLSALDVALAVEGHVAESVAVDELHSPFEDTNEAAQDAETNLADHVTIASCLVASHRAELAQELNDGHDERAKGDAAKAVGKSTASGAASGTLGRVVRAEVPCSIDTRDNDMRGVLDPFRDPVGGERDEDEQSNDGT
jgi:hypothetical protein